MTRAQATRRLVEQGPKKGNERVKAREAFVALADRRAARRGGHWLGGANLPVVAGG